LTCCVSCRSKTKSSRSVIAAVKPIATVFPETNSRCRVDFIDMQFQPNEPKCFVMVYEDCSTKFVKLRSLTSQSASKVVGHILDIFCIFGAPSILQSFNGRKLMDRIINELRTVWPALKIIRGKFRQNREIVKRLNQDVRTMLNTWM